MRINNSTRPIVQTIAMSILAVSVVACGSSSTSPSGPGGSGGSSSSKVTGVALSVTTATPGSTVQGTVTIASAAPEAGAVVTLASSNPSVATVPAQITVPAGASTASVAVSTVAPGSAAITATLNGSSQQSPMLTVTPTVAVTVSSLTLSAPFVVGGGGVTATVTLNSAAPAGGSVVALSTTLPAAVPDNVTVAAGSNSATFMVETKDVGGTAVATISASLGGKTVTAALSVTRTTQATASFGVTGPSETETCVLTNSGNTLDCTFNGSTSSAPGRITKFDWSYGVAKMFTQSTSDPVLSKPTVDCSIIPSGPLPAGVTWFTMTVKLVIHDDEGNVSPETVDMGARLIPKGVCGF